MKSKISSKWSVTVLGIAGIAFSSIIIFFLTLALPSRGFYMKPASPASSQSPQNLIAGMSVGYVQNVASGEQAGSGLPIRLKIPRINVDAALEYVGLTPQGAVGVPKGPTNAAWFDFGPRPGDSGSAVIVGHEGWKDGIAAVFDDLYKLHTGDRVYVEDGRGTITAFVVREVRTYDQNGDASDVFGLNDGKAHLNLITCEGVWNKTQKSYSNRLVVFTDKEIE